MNVFIGCSSRENLDKIYIDSAIKLAKYLSHNHYHLICGGCAGMMKIIQDVFRENKQEISIIGVKGYHDDEVKKMKNVYLCDNVRERKNTVIEKADLILCLPGGVGTIDELFSAIESKRAKEHNRTIIIVNINHYYDSLIEQLNKIYQEGFGSEEEKNYDIANSVEELIYYLNRNEESNEVK